MYVDCANSLVKQVGKSNISKTFRLKITLLTFPNRVILNCYSAVHPEFLGQRSPANEDAISQKAAST